MLSHQRRTHGIQLDIFSFQLLDGLMTVLCECKATGISFFGGQGRTRPEEKHTFAQIFFLCKVMRPFAKIKRSKANIHLLVQRANLVLKPKVHMASSLTHKYAKEKNESMFLQRCESATTFKSIIHKVEQDFVVSPFKGYLDRSSTKTKEKIIGLNNTIGGSINIQSLFQQLKSARDV